MENDTTKPTTKSKAKKETTVETVAEVAQKAEPEKKPEPIRVKDIDMHQYITVRNGFQGTLVYVSRKTGERFVWEGFGSEQEMELNELKSARNSSKAFFINNWFMFDEDWVIDFLGIRQYYKNVLSIDDFDDIFTMSPSDIEKTLAKLSAGQKKSIAYRARQMLADDMIDSRKTIATLEACLGVQLIEH